MFARVASLHAALLACLAAPTGAVAAQRSDTQQFTSVMQDLRIREYRPIRDNILKSIGKLDAAKLDFRPLPALRSVREELEHIAAVNYRLCGQALTGLEAPKPQQQSAATTPRSKPDLDAYVRGSFDLCDRALTRIDDAQALEKTVGPYMRYSHLQAMVTHCGHEYGKLTVVLRLMGLVPPSSDG